RPSSTAQNTRWSFGGSRLPPAVMMSMTSDAESDDVTKNVMMTSTARDAVTTSSGNRSRSTNSDTGRLSSTAAAMPPSPNISMLSALLPETVIHRNVTIVGTNRTPLTNPRTLRPYEMRAMNMPTNGDHEIHQPQ